MKNESLKELMCEALLNNSYDHDPMHATLRKTWENSYSYLYTLQKSYVEYEELFFSSNETTGHDHTIIGNLYLNEQFHACFDIDYDLIHVYSREKFRRSKFYQTEFWSGEIIDNPDIFLKIPIVLIDNQVIWTYKLKISRDGVTFILPFRRTFVLKNERNPETDDVVYVDHNIQVFIVDNMYSEQLLLTKYTSNYNKETKSITIPKIMMKELPDWAGTMFCSLHFPTKNNHYEDLGTTLLQMHDIGYAYEVYLPTEVAEKVAATIHTFVAVPIFFNRLLQHRFYTGEATTRSDGVDCNLMVIQREELVPYEMPIPVEDFFILKKDRNTEETHVVKNTDTLTMYYPNIYRITDSSMRNGDEYTVFYFYYDAGDTLKYTPLHEFYFMFLLDTFKGKCLEEIIDLIYRDEMKYDMFTPEQIHEFRKTFKYIINYHYFNHQYGEIDFLHRYSQIPENVNKTPWQYQVETLKSWILVDPNVLRNYVRDQMKLGSSYHLFTNTLDLSKRIRTNTSYEIGVRGIDFEEERYVFAFKNEKEYPLELDCRVFVDGLLVIDLIQERSMFMDYLYIPKKLVTEDSYIEIEIFPSYSFEHTIHFDSLEDEKEINILEPTDNIYPTVADMYCSVAGDNEVRYTKEFFNIKAEYEQGEYLLETKDPKKPVKFTRLNRFKIIPTAKEILGKDVTVHFSKIPHSLEVYVDRAGFPYIQFVENNFNFNIHYLRIFRNGRLIPREKYLFYYSYQAPRVQLLDWCEVGEIIYIDVAPYQYTEVYYQKELSPNNLIVDLKGVINKPFDIRYYDVFLNGRKLSLNNVMHIDPWSFTLVNLKSVYNLTIYEKERDWEYFGLDYYEGMYYFSYEDLFKKSFVSEEERNEMIKQLIDHQKDHRLNIYPNTNDEEPQDYDDYRNWVLFHTFYYYELIPKQSVNPDTKQFDRMIMADQYWSVDNMYHKKATEYARDSYERQERAKQPDILYLDPDNAFKGEPPDKQQMVFPVGHLDNDVEAELLEDSISVNTKYDIGGED